MSCTTVFIKRGYTMKHGFYPLLLCYIARGSMDCRFRLMTIMGPISQLLDDHLDVSSTGGTPIYEPFKNWSQLGVPQFMIHLNIICSLETIHFWLPWFLHPPEQINSNWPTGRDHAKKKMCSGPQGTHKTPICWIKTRVSHQSSLVE